MRSRRRDSSSLVILGLAALAGLIIWLISKQRTAQTQLPPGQEVVYLPPGAAVPTQPSRALVPAATYENEERWEIQYNEDGLPTKVIVHRNAQRAI